MMMLRTMTRQEEQRRGGNDATGRQGDMFRTSLLKELV
jgi:hypothetical protein